MAKQKIHELAKELKVSNRAIVDYMNKKIKDKEKEKKYTSSNTLEAEEIAEIRANREMLAKADTKPSDARQSDAKASGAKADTKKTDGKAKASGESRPKKKASITAVFNAQYSKQNQKPNRGNKSGGERRDSRRDRKSVV